MLRFGGHIGYGIRPTERRKGYNKINLYLGIVEAKKVGLEKVMLDCDVNNIGSDKTLKALGGVLERTEIDPSDGILTNVYWFNVDDTIEKYKDVYEEYIIHNDYNYIYQCTKKDGCVIRLSSGLDGSRTRVQKPFHDSSTSVVCYLKFPWQIENKHPRCLSSFIIRPYTQSLMYVVSHISRSLILKCECFRSDGLQLGSHC